MTVAATLTSDDRAEIARIILDALSFYDSHHRMPKATQSAALAALIRLHADMKREVAGHGAKGPADPNWVGPSLVETWASIAFMDLRWNDSERAANCRRELELFARSNLSAEEIADFQSKTWG